MAKFLVTYKVERIDLQSDVVEEDDVMAALDNARKRAKFLTTDQEPETPMKTIWNVVGIKSLDGE